MPLRESLNDDAARKQRRREGAEQREGDRTQSPPLVSSLGNAAVQRLLRSSERDEEHPEVDGSVQSAIEAKRGSGASLDGGTQQRLGGALQADFSDVRVHADAEASELNQAVSADAFTTGSDVFFREGKYQPGTSDGDRLLAHELTHVVQQRSGPSESGSLRVSNPDDAGERQAEAVAEHLTASGTASSAGLARQAPEEEELAQTSPHLDRQEPEEDELAMAPHLDRQEPEEDELAMAPHLDRQEPEEDELAMASPHLDRQGEDDREPV